MTSENVYPFWHIDITRVGEGTPQQLRDFFTGNIDCFSIEGLREVFRHFMHHPIEATSCSPIEIEVIRTSQMKLLFVEGRSETVSRGIYHVDFRFNQQRDLIGHGDYVQNEIIYAWVTLGGRFIHRVTHYHEGRPIRIRERKHRPIPQRYIPNE